MRKLPTSHRRDLPRRHRVRRGPGLRARTRRGGHTADRRRRSPRPGRTTHSTRTRPIPTSCASEAPSTRTRPAPRGETTSACSTRASPTHDYRTKQNLPYGSSAFPSIPVHAVDSTVAGQRHAARSGRVQDPRPIRHVLHGADRLRARRPLLLVGGDRHEPRRPVRRPLERPVAVHGRTGRRDRPEPVRRPRGPTVALLQDLRRHQPRFCGIADLRRAPHRRTD